MRFLCIVLAAATLAFSQEKIKIAVMDLKAQSGIDNMKASSLTNLLCTAVSDLGNYEVISRDDMQAMLEHVANKQLLGCDDTKCLVEIGGALGVSQIISGDIGMIGNTYLINLKFIDIDSAKVLNRISEQYNGKEDGLLIAIQNAGRKLLGIKKQIAYANAATTDGKYGSFTDERDGRKYKTVKIGEQVWMAENLNYDMPNSWWYKNKEENGKIYGRLYTWDAAMSAGPAGWHLPSDDEWKTLEMFLGMSQKEAERATANIYNLRGTDQGKQLLEGGATGFNALPSGSRLKGGSFFNIKNSTAFWTSTLYNEEKGWEHSLIKDTKGISRYYAEKEYGFSVRCIMDSPEQGSINTGGAGNISIAKAYYDQAVACIKSGKYKEAVDNSSRAIAADQAFSKPYKSRGFAYLRLKDTARAAQDLNKYLAMDNNSDNDFNQVRTTLKSIGATPVK